jgi:hypothetical protein
VHVVYKGNNRIYKKKKLKFRNFFVKCWFLYSTNAETNKHAESEYEGFLKSEIFGLGLQRSPDFREVRGLGRPKSSGFLRNCYRCAVDSTAHTGRSYNSSAGPIVLLARALESHQSDHPGNGWGFFFDQFITCQSSKVTISEETENLFALHYFRRTKLAPRRRRPRNEKSESIWGRI